MDTHPAWSAVRLLAVIALPVVSVPAYAQQYPSKPVRLVVPYPPGGGADNIARLIVQSFSEALGTQVVIDNRGGASGIIGADIVAKSAPDGYTLLDDGTSHVVNPALHKLPYDTLKAFAPIGTIVMDPNILVAHPSLPAENVKDLLALAKSRAGKLTYASAGIASSPHLAGELFSFMGKVNMLHVPYKGGGPALTELIGGHVDLLFSNLASGLGHVKAGRLKALAVTSSVRAHAAPQIPTVAESGIAGYDFRQWNALFAPGGTPPAIVARINAALNQVMNAPAMQKHFLDIGAEPVTGSPQELGAYVRTEMVKWEKLVKTMNLKVE